ncbi:MAG: hypothetical protein ABL966_11115 [Acidimicrobiales bacterium]
MRHARLLTSAVVMLIASFAAFSAAGAGAATISGTVTCAPDTETGGWTITVTITNSLGQPGTLAGGYDSIEEGGGEGTGGDLDFDPNPVAASGGTSSAEFVVPLNTAQVGGQVIATYPDAPNSGFIIDGSGDIAEICGDPVDPPVVPPVDPPAEPVVPVVAPVAQPNFTG